MGRSDREWSRIGENRFAFAVVVGSLVVAAIVAGLYAVGVLDPYLPPELLSITALPLYVIGIAAVIAVVVWSWERVASLFERP